MTSSTFDPNVAARFIADAHAQRATYRNLPEEIAPRTVDEAYATQEALRALWEPLHGPVAGWKIATTTKVMQALMGIDYPCGGMIYGRRIHLSPFELKLGNHMHVVIECELAVRLRRALVRKAMPWTADEVLGEVAAAMPAFELIEDRNAVYKETRALSLIADNSWNAGIVLGNPIPVGNDGDLDGRKARLETPSGPREGATDNPMGALAWVANLGIERGRPIEAGQVVITGSVLPTLPISAGERFTFTIDGLGSIEIAAV